MTENVYNCDKMFRRLGVAAFLSDIAKVSHAQELAVADALFSGQFQ